ncbi:hypothetical protein DEM27_10280 [Metarhizobium album]|uniref:Uncharacterized protein n=1 Tax=Metarhizobium album TaxID=2182425 RepID=A0A2U2DTX9_9HYPH|nr:hypothetical protein [Rhizobium album]PWE56741.1 hypothetical protein DEM27_10280 [Rhizobium album]
MNSNAIIKVCSYCKGAGFLRVKREDVPPQMNIARAIVIRANGQKEPAITSGYQADNRIVELEFKCNRCRETGEVMWTRGKSISPLIS